jgi:5-methylthioribose kinase
VLIYHYPLCYNIQQQHTTLNRGPKSTVIVKQALPYVRCVGESWPLSLQRAHYENEALKEQYKHCNKHTPKVIDTF